MLNRGTTVWYRTNKNAFIIYAYNEMLNYYKKNIDKPSKYANIIITNDLIERVANRKRQLMGISNG